jgi:hypothetical protein
MTITVPIPTIKIEVGSSSFGKKKKLKITSIAPPNSKKSKIEENKEEKIAKTIELNSINDEENDFY